jgi:hypothetical protein
VTTASIVVLFQGTAVVLGELELPMRAVLERVCRSIAAVALMGGGVLAFQLSLPVPQSMPAEALQLALQVLVGAVSYIVIHYLLWKVVGSPNDPESNIIPFLVRRLHPRR